MREISGDGSGTNLAFPTLTHSNYTDWALITECNLQAASLWVATKDDTVSRKEDRQAVAALIRSTPPEMDSMLMAKACPKKAWASIGTQRLGSDRVHEANAQRLQADFENIAFKDGECVDNFAMRIDGLATQLRSLGDTVDDARIVQKFCASSPLAVHM